MEFDLYRDIAERTDGDVYIGVVGPVRTGKSTFISRFMEELVLPRMAPGPKRDRLLDELPQSGSGRTIMTTQPKFVPSEAVEVSLQDDAAVRVRMVDSVGYIGDVEYKKYKKVTEEEKKAAKEYEKTVLTQNKESAESFGS